jgi:protein SCO1/2
MNSKFRIIALILIIALPIFFFLLFRPLGKIPRPKAPAPMYPRGVLENGDTIYHTIPNYKFQTQVGDTLEMDSLRGKLFIVDFFFTTCAGVCPRMTSQMERIQKSFIKDEQLKLVSFSVDEAKDSVSALRAYADAHNAVPGKWYFLRGSEQEIFDMAQKGFFVTAKEDETPQDFVHSEKFVLVDYYGRIRGYYNGLDSLEVNKCMANVALLLRDMEKNYSFRKDPNKKSRIKDLF